MLLFRLLAIFLFIALGFEATAWADGTMNSKTGKTRTTEKKIATKPEPSYYSLCLVSNPKHEEDLWINYIVISLAEQRLYAYHGNMIVAWSDVSTGKVGKETPVGSYRVSQKNVDHYSNLYNNAPMPYFMRMTNCGIGMHAGELPGYAASKGCIRLPYAMAKELYQHVAPGTLVEVVAGPADYNLASSRSVTASGKRVAAK